MSDDNSASKANSFGLVPEGLSLLGKDERWAATVGRHDLREVVRDGARVAVAVEF